MSGFYDIAVQSIDGSPDLPGEKFPIGRDGKVLKRYEPGLKPQDSGIMQDIAAAS